MQLTLLLLLGLAQPALLLSCPLRLAQRSTPALALSRPGHAGAPRARAAVMQAEDDAAPTAEAEEAPAEAAEAPAEAPAAEPPAKTEKELLKEKIAALEAQLKVARGALIEQQEQVKDAGEAGYMLLAADFERFRLQARTELDLQGGVGKKASIKPLLPFVEEFERLQALGGAEDAAGAIHKYYGGIYKQLTQLLESWAVESFETAVGDLSDPILHSKAKIVQSDEPAGTILEVTAKGWTIGGETLRPAACVVSSGPPPPPTEDAAEEEPASDDAPAADAAEVDADAAEA